MTSSSGYGSLPISVDERLGLRPLTARSVIASTLLGTHPPVLPSRVLVAAAKLFGVSDTAARSALSRMVTKGDLVADDGRYWLGDRLLSRQQQQDIGVAGHREPWSGCWLLRVITAGARTPSARAEQRGQLSRTRFGELREGVWTRPDNLGPSTLSPSADLITGRFEPNDPLPIGDLWDLGGWADQANGLTAEMVTLTPFLESSDRSALARGFIVAAAVLRLLQRDPLLPGELLSPDWPGESLRKAYQRFDAAHRQLLRAWFATEAPKQDRT